MLIFLYVLAKNITLNKYRRIFRRLERCTVTMATRKGQSVAFVGQTGKLSEEQTDRRTDSRGILQTEGGAGFVCGRSNSPSAVSMTLGWWLWLRETPRIEATWGRSTWCEEHSDRPVTSGGAKWLSVMSGFVGLKGQGYFLLSTLWENLNHGTAKGQPQRLWDSIQRLSAPFIKSKNNVLGGCILQQAWINHFKEGWPTMDYVYDCCTYFFR